MEAISSVKEDRRMVYHDWIYLARANQNNLTNVDT